MATGPPSHLANPAAHQGTWDLDGCQGLRTESRGYPSTSDSLPTSYGQTGMLVPNSSHSGVSQLCEPHPTPTDTVNGRQQAMSKLGIYSIITYGLGWPLGQRESPCPFPPYSQCLSPSPSLTHACSPFSPLPFLSSSVPFWFPVSFRASASLLA